MSDNCNNVKKSYDIAAKEYSVRCFNELENKPEIYWLDLQA